MSPAIRTPKTTILIGDVRAQLRTLAPGSVHCCVTSPPYWGLRAYGTDPQVWGGDANCEHTWTDSKIPDMTGGTKSISGNAKSQPHAIGRACGACGAWRGELGSEPTPELFCRNMVEVFREVWRVLRDDGTCWINMGDSYASSGWKGHYGAGATGVVGNTMTGECRRVRFNDETIKPKDLCGIPWQLAFALRSDGWYLRSEIIWHKPNPMPESVTDRPTKAHEQIFLMTKSARYFFDQEAVRETNAEGSFERFGKNPEFADRTNGKHYDSGCLAEYSKRMTEFIPTGRNLRTVWSIATEPYAEAHFATFPKAIPEKCIKAGTSEKGCCSECGAPWTRVVEKERRATRPGEKTKVEGPGSRMHVSRAPNHPTEANGKVRLDGLTTGNRDPQRHVTESITTGWEPSCKCGAGDPVPCLVLDCFNGSGTSGVVANALGRDYVGTELNPEYAEMAKRRIAKGYDPAPKAEVLAGQKSLFGETN